MRTSWLFGAIALAACGDAKQPATPDAPRADAASDGAPDGTVASTCPMRTQPAGVPEHTYAPAEVHLGDVTLSSPTDVAALAGIKELSGSLTLDGTLTDVSLPDLEVVTGDLLAPGAQLGTIAVPRLETVGGWLRVHTAQAAIVGWSSPRLESVGKGTGVVSAAIDLPCLQTSSVSLLLQGVQTDPFELPAFTTSNIVQLSTAGTVARLPALAGGTLQVSASPQLATLEAGAPETLDVTDAPALATLTLTTSDAIKDVTLSNVGVATLDFLGHAPGVVEVIVSGAPALHDVGGAAQPALIGVRIVDAPLVTSLGALGDAALTGDLVLQHTGLTSIAFPNVTALTSPTLPGQLIIRSNASLTTLSIPNLTALDDMAHYITDNPNLPSAQAQAIANQVTIAPGGTLTIANNGP